MQDSPWVLHEHPERPLDRYAWICSCNGCAIAVRAASVGLPAGLACIKRDDGRDIVSLETLAVLLERRSLDRESIREVFVFAC